MRTGMYTGLGECKDEWVWDEELHGGISELMQGKLPLETGRTVPVKQWTYHDAFCGMGGLSSGLKLAGGVCTGAFELEAGARKIFEERMGMTPDGAWGSFQTDKWGQADVLVTAPPCEDKLSEWEGNEDRLM